MKRLLLLLSALVVSAPALDVSGTAFPDRQTINGVELAVTGGARLKWKWVFTIYDAAFYHDAGTALGDPLADVAKRYELVYRRTFTAAECIEATDKTIGRGLPPAEKEAARAAIAQLNAAYVSVKDGDRFAYTYLPGIGTIISVNGRELARIPGRDLARVLFAIWVGPDPVDEDFRDRLLGRSG
jgi:hypothetical protein